MTICFYHIFFITLSFSKHLSRSSLLPGGVTHTFIPEGSETFLINEHRALTVITTHHTAADYTMLLHSAWTQGPQLLLGQQQSS